jgi:CheY-like chemotaxis protein
MHTLLLADDNATVQRVIELTFSSEDIKVVVVSDGEQAIARILAEPPDIVLADIDMPKRNGYDVAAFVKGRPELAHIPVLLLAGAFEPVDSVRAEHVKCDGVLVKPFEPQAVIARVRELVAGAQGAPIRATADVPRPIERLAPLKLVESTRREKSEATMPAVATALPPRESVQRDGALDEYFDRLDAAFANLNTRDIQATGRPSESRLPSQEPSQMSAPRDSDDALDVPTMEQVSAMPAAPRNATASPRTPIELAQYALPPLESRTLALADLVVESPDVPPTRAPDVALPTTAVAPSQGEASGDDRNVIAQAFAALLAAEQGKPYDVRAISLAPPAPPVITDEIVDHISRRILERLAPEAMKAVVADIVADVAERLVREEIARIRGKR